MKRRSLSWMVGLVATLVPVGAASAAEPPPDSLEDAKKAVANAQMDLCKAIKENAELAEVVGKPSPAPDLVKCEAGMLPELIKRLENSSLTGAVLFRQHHCEASNLLCVRGDTMAVVLSDHLASRVFVGQTIIVRVLAPVHANDEKSQYQLTARFSQARTASAMLFRPSENPRPAVAALRATVVKSPPTSEALIQELRELVALKAWVDTLARAKWAVTDLVGTVPANSGQADFEVIVERRRDSQVDSLLFSAPIEYGLYYLDIGILTPFVYKGSITIRDSTVTGAAVATRSAKEVDGWLVSPAAVLKWYPAGRRIGAVAPWTGDMRWGDLFNFEVGLNFELAERQIYYAGFGLSFLDGLSLSAGCAFVQSTRLDDDFEPRVTPLAAGEAYPTNTDFVPRFYFGVTLSSEIIAAVKAASSDTAQSPTAETDAGAE